MLITNHLTPGIISAPADALPPPKTVLSALNLLEADARRSSSAALRVPSGRLVGAESSSLEMAGRVTDGNEAERVGIENVCSVEVDPSVSVNTMRLETVSVLT